MWPQIMAAGPSYIQWRIVCESESQFIGITCFHVGCKAVLNEVCLRLADLKSYILALPPKVWHSRCYSNDIALSACTLCTHLQELALQV